MSKAAAAQIFWLWANGTCLPVLKTNRIAPRR